MKVRLPFLSPYPTGWNRWFAWRPIVIGDQLVWLQSIERSRGRVVRGNPFESYESEGWIYRLAIDEHRKAAR